MPHIHELHDFVVAVYIVYDGKVLLVNHPRYGHWVAPGGHIELDEDPEQTLYREITEETGLQVEILSSKPAVDSPGTKFLLTPNYLDVHNANPPHKHISLTYFARAKDGAFVLSAEHTDMKWFSKDDLQAPTYNISSAVQFYAQEAIKGEGT
jgi:ADP-ribose pyrophosphatase YjhB (NUDIX family)